jgi:hypothetical protein
MIANANRDKKVRPEPFEPLDFIFWNEHAAGESKPVLLADPEAQSNLLLRKMFPKKKTA